MLNIRYLLYCTTRSTVIYNKIKMRAWLAAGASLSRVGDRRRPRWATGSRSSHTGWRLAARKGSPTSNAIERYGAPFPQREFEYPYSFACLVVSAKPDTHPVLSLDVEGLTRVVVNATVGSCPDDAPCWWRRAEGIYVPDQGLDFDPALFVTSDRKTATLIRILTNHGFDGGAMEVAWTAAEARIAKWMSNQTAFSSGSMYSVSYTHEEMLLREASSHLVADFEHGDMITLPIAWLMLLLSRALSLGSGFNASCHIHRCILRVGTCGRCQDAGCECRLSIPLRVLHARHFCQLLHRHLFRLRFVHALFIQERT